MGAKMERPVIFVSYRRDDAAANAGRLFDWLARQFGRDRIFLDTDKIVSGAEFPRVLEERLAASDVLLAVIGPQWLAIADAAGPRLKQPEDYVRREISTALEGKIRIIPVLVQGARMPAAQDLPDVLRPLAERNAARLDNASFERDFDVLVDDILGRRRGFLRRELDRLQRLMFVATRSAFVTPLLVAVLALAVWMKALDAFTLDTQAASYLMWAAELFHTSGAEPAILLATIDAASERSLGREFGSATAAAWRRDHARLIDRAAAAGAVAVVFDLFFESDSLADGELAQAARRAAAEPFQMRTVFGVRMVESGRPRLASGLREAGAWGSLCIVRRLGYAFMAPLAVLQVRDEGTLRIKSDVVPAAVPALALTATRSERLQSVDLSRRQIGLAGPPLPEPVRYTAVERIRWSQGGCRTLATDDDVAMLMIRLDNPGYWREPARSVSYADLLNSDRVPDDRLRGRILLIGVTDAGNRNVNPDLHDVMRGISRTQVYGVELQASAIANLVNGQVIKTPTADLQVLISAAMAIGGAAASFFTATLPRGRRRAILVLSVIIYLLIAVALAAGGWLLNALYDLAAFFFAHGLLRWLQARSLRGVFTEVPA
jgi:CHASE2 domain-containing sensor protein